MLDLLDQEDGIWLNEKKTEAVLTVAAAAAPYFRRRKLIAQQRIDKELEDGGLIISGKFAHPDQMILPSVEMWRKWWEVKGPRLMLTRRHHPNSHLNNRLTIPGFCGEGR